MLIRSNVGRGLAALGVLAALSSTAHADRRTGMAGNLLIEDKDDVYAFPHLTLQYRNMVNVDYGGTDNVGNALLTLGGDSFAFGVALHRGDVLTPQLIARNTELAYVNPPGSLFAPEIGQAPATVVDLLFSFGDIGFRAAIGRGLTSMTNAMGDTTSDSNTFIMGEVGWGNGAVRGQATRLDISGSVLLDLGGAQVAGDDTFSGTNITVGGLLRGYIPQDDTMDLGVLANLSVNSLTVSDETNDFSRSSFGLNVGGGVGPAFRFGGAQVAAYGTVRVGYTANDPHSEIDDNETGTLGVVIPGAHVAAEIPLTDWFVVRTGAQYEWNLVNTSGPDEAGSASQSGNFGWNAGVGVIIDQFRFDGALQQGFLLSGPDFIGGNTNGFFAIASLTYNFDGYRSGAVPVEEEESAPATEPEPAPEPAPAFAPAPPPGEPAPAAAEDPEAGLSGSASGSISIGGGTQ